MRMKLSAGAMENGVLELLGIGVRCSNMPVAVVFIAAIAVSSPISPVSKSSLLPSTILPCFDPCSKCLTTTVL